MKLSTELRSSLVGELRFASKSMKTAQSLGEKLYFFSVVFGTANRIMNIEFDPELAFLHHVTNAAYGAMIANLNLINSGQMISTISPNLFSKLEGQVDVLADLVETNKPTYSALQEIANLAYSMTGNGYYLFLKGALVI